MRRINEKFWYDKDARVVRICNEYIALAKTHTEGEHLAAELNNVMSLWCNEPAKKGKLTKADGHNRSGEAGSCTKCGAVHPVDRKRCRKEQGAAEPGNSCLQTPGTCESCPKHGLAKHRSEAKQRAKERKAMGRKPGRLEDWAPIIMGPRNKRP